MNTENNEAPPDPRRRLRELLAIPERDRTDPQWDEINELEIQLAPGNRINAGGGGGGGGGGIGGGGPGRPFQAKRHNPKGGKGGKPRPPRPPKTG